MRQPAGVRLNRVHHIAIIAADHQASKRFYCDILGCELLTEGRRTDPHTGRAMTFFFNPDGRPLELYHR